MSGIPGPWDDVVSGTIIGDVTFPYEFLIDEPRPEYQHKTGIPNRRVHRGFYSSDEEAIEDVKRLYPAEFKHGLEMRVFE